MNVTFSFRNDKQHNSFIIKKNYRLSIKLSGNISRRSVCRPVGESLCLKLLPSGIRRVYVHTIYICKGYRVMPF